MNDMNQKIIGLAGDRYLYSSNHNQVINAGIKDLFLEHGSEREMFFQDVDVDEEVIKRKISHLHLLSLEVTENCNLRCKYCVYNGHYINERKFSPRKMDFATARKGLDYIFSFIKERKKKLFYIGFYGGEPLLNFETIKQVVTYGKNLFAGWDLRFNMTTNLTLLDETILDFLVENNFSLLVSLDGGKENHDAKRVFSDGRGTFDTVMKNLKKISRRYKDYFEDKVTFSTVYSRDLSLKNLYDFFTGNDLVKKKRVRFTHVKIFGTDYYEHYPYKRDRYSREQKEIFSRVLDKIRREEDLAGYEECLLTNFKSIGDSIETRVCTSLAGTCMFDSRMYLSAQGQFHICEKMNNTFPIGDVVKGFCFEKMVAMVRDFCALIKENCSNCNIRFLCNPCYVQFAGDGYFRQDPEYCTQKKESIINNLENYIRLKEEGLL